MINFVDTSGPRYTGSHAKKSPPMNEPFRVITWNIKFCIAIEVAIAEFQHVNDLQNAAVLLLQEMDREGVEQVAQVLNYNYVYYPASIHSRTGRAFGNAVLSHWPIIDTVKIVLPHASPTNRQRRIAVGAYLDIGRQRMAVYSVHTETPVMPWGKRREQLIYLSESVSTESHDCTIMGGDFNTFTNRSIALLDNTMSAVNLLPGTENREPTLKRGLLSFVLDHIYISGTTPIAAGVWSETAASDHSPLWVMLYPRPRKVPVG